MSKRTTSLTEIFLNKKAECSKKSQTCIQRLLMFNDYKRCIQIEYRWKSETISPVLNRILDKIHNYSIFSITQRINQHMLFWKNGHSGGMKGQNQNMIVHVYSTN